MAIQLNVNGPSGRSSWSAPRGPTEAVIAFKVEGQAVPLQSGMHHHHTFGTHNIRPTDATIIWYHSLGDAERQIKGIQLHEIPRHPPFIVLSMKDDSFLSLDISPTRNSVDVIRLTEITDLAPPSIRVDFSQESKGEGSYVDLKFVVAICHAVLYSNSLIDTESGTPTVMRIPQCRRLFALAIFLSVVRKSLPINESLIKGIRSLSYVDDFWLEVLSSCQCYGRLLWEKNIIKKMHQEIRSWIHIAARQQLEDSIPSITPCIIPQVHVNDEPEPDFKTRKQRVAASVAAWLEFSADKAKISVAESWDVEWDRTWPLEWSKNWKTNWNNTKGVSQFASCIDSIPQVPTASIFCGHAAGRAAIEVSLVANAVHVPPWSLLALETAAPIDFHDPVGASNTHSWSNEYNWLGSWHSTRHPDLKQPGKWLPTWEAARNLAWALAWESPETQGRSSTEVPQGWLKPGKPGALQKYDPNKAFSLLSPPTKDKGSLHSSHGSLSQLGESMDNLLQIAGTQIRVLLKRLNPEHVERRTGFSRGIDGPNIHELSKAAWYEVSGETGDLGPNTNKYILEQAKSVLVRLRSETIQGLHSGIPYEETWKSVYSDTLKKTWQKCWESAWVKVMHDTMAGLDQWRCQVDCRPQDKVLVSDISSFESYNKLKEYLNGGGSKEDNHWRIRSAFKALNLLQKALSHSVPTCYRETMRISYFRDRPFEFSTPNPRPGLKHLAKVIQQDREEQINHNELQSIIKGLALADRSPKFPGKYDAIKQMEEIWRIANDIESKEGFLSGQDFNYERLWE
ncbi:hypothetical protein OPQ81_003104 [Rhizoctonia solani]|nr:hypothetical protein OPQ81_003104 [Rhizoctonia solani]